MSQRTIIEINHDFIGDSSEVRAMLMRIVDMLPTASERQLKTEAREGNGVRVLSQRNSADHAELMINGHSVWAD